MVEIQAFPISLFMSVMLGLVAPQREGWDKYFALFTQVSRWYSNPLLSHSWELHTDYQQVFCRICKSNTIWPHIGAKVVGFIVYSSELSNSWELHMHLLQLSTRILQNLLKQLSMATYCCSLYVGPTVYSSELLIPKTLGWVFLGNCTTPLLIVNNYSAESEPC